MRWEFPRIRQLTRAIASFPPLQYMDAILSQVHVSRNRLQLAAMACVLIATKFEEQEDVIPPLADLNETSDNAYTPSLIEAMELSILKRLNWYMKAVTPLHFLEYYSLYSTGTEDTWSERLASTRVKHYVDRYAQFFIDMCLQESKFLDYNPSLVAAASIAAARVHLDVTPSWSARLQSVTGYAPEELQECVIDIQETYQKNFNGAVGPNGSPRAVAEAPIVVDEVWM